MRKKRLIQTIQMNLRGGALSRGRFLREKGIVGEVGEYVQFQPRVIPLYPELIHLHNNIMIGAGVRLITHDATFAVLKRCNRGRKYPEKVGCIEIMDNVFIGANAIILPNIRIGENVIVGAGAVVSRDLAPDGVYVGVPAKRICSFHEFCKRLDSETDTGGIPIPSSGVTDRSRRRKWNEPGRSSWKSAQDNRTRHPARAA